MATSAHRFQTVPRDDNVLDNEFLRDHFLPNITNNPGPHPERFYLSAEQAVHRAFILDFDPQIYVNCAIQSGDLLVHKRSEAGWNEGFFPALLADNDLLATRNVPHSVLLGFCFPPGELPYSLAWREVARYATDVRPWDAIAVSRYCGNVADAGATMAIADTPVLAGLRYTTCECMQRCIFAQTELHPRHQRALWAIIVIEYNRMIDKAVLEAASRR